jgi:hypothetical protein
MNVPKVLTAVELVQIQQILKFLTYCLKSPSIRKLCASFKISNIQTYISQLWSNNSAASSIQIVNSHNSSRQIISTSSFFSSKIKKNLIQPPIKLFLLIITYQFFSEKSQIVDWNKKDWNGKNDLFKLLLNIFCFLTLSKGNKFFYVKKWRKNILMVNIFLRFFRPFCNIFFFNH